MITVNPLGDCTHHRSLLYVEMFEMLRCESMVSSWHIAVAMASEMICTLKSKRARLSEEDEPVSEQKQVAGIVFW